MRQDSDRTRIRSLRIYVIKVINITCAFFKYEISLSCYQKVVTRHLRSTDADMSLVRPTSRCILFDDENISFDVSLVI